MLALRQVLIVVVSHEVIVSSDEGSTGRCRCWAGPRILILTLKRLEGFGRVDHTTTAFRDRGDLKVWIHTSQPHRKAIQRSTSAEEERAYEFVFRSSSRQTERHDLLLDVLSFGLILLVRSEALVAILVCGPTLVVHLGERLCLLVDGCESKETSARQ
jgi:hypothetical protein